MRNDEGGLTINYTVKKLVVSIILCRAKILQARVKNIVRNAKTAISRVHVSIFIKRNLLTYVDD